MTNNEKLQAVRELLLRSGPREKEVVLREMYKAEKRLRSLSQNDHTNDQSV